MHLKISLPVTTLFFLLGQQCLGASRLENEFRDFIVNRIITDYLRNTIRDFVSNVFDHWKDKVTSAAICNTCKAFISVCLYVIRNDKMDERTLRGHLAKICSFIESQDPDVCRRVINLNWPHIYYIVKEKKNLTADEICGTVFQSKNCNEELQEWSVKIKGNGRINKSKGIYRGNHLKILHITDIHYDPLYVPATLAACKKPLCCEEESGVVKKESTKAGNWADYRKCDIPLNTITDSLQHISEEHTDIDYLYFTGDIISHRIWDTSDKNNTRDIRLIMDEIKTYFNVPIYSVLGNHEPHPCNVFPPLDIDHREFAINWLFKEVNDIWPKFMGNYTEDTIAKGGFYTHLVKPGFRVIGINSNVAYTWNWWLLYDPVDPYGQLQWMTDILHEAEENNEYVHLLSHLPSSDEDTHKIWSREFRKIIDRYSNTIVAMFNGHTHTDEFILYHSRRDSKIPIAVAWNGGSLTPYTDVNVNYRIYTIDLKNYEVTDYDQYIFNVTDASKSTSSPCWYKLYSFKDEYNVKDLTPISLRSLMEKMAQDENLADVYIRHRMKDTDVPQTCDRGCKRKIFCAALRSEFNDNNVCRQLNY